MVRFVFGGEEVTRNPGGLGRPYTVVYDGTCRVCTRLTRLLDRWDAGKQIEIVPSQNSSVRVRFPWIPERAYAESVQLIGPGGETLQAAAALERLLDVLPAGGIFGWVFHVPGARRVLDRFYKWFARNRYKFGCGEHCSYRRLSVDYQDV